MTERYKIGPGLPNEGFAYDFSVLDTQQPDIDGESDVVCECLSEEMARKIVNALNLADGVRVQYVPVLKIGDVYEFASRRLFPTKGEAELGHGSRVAQVLIPDSTH